MQPKFKIISVFFICALTISLSIAKLDLSTYSFWGSYTEIIRSKLEMITYSHQLSSSAIAPQLSYSDQYSTIAARQTTIAKVSGKQSQSALNGFPLGWYDSVDYPNTLAKIVDEGMNIVIPYTGNNNISEVKAYLDRAAAAGIKVVVEIPRNDVKSKRTEKIIQFVRELKSHPATFGWYLYDEPDPYRIAPKTLRQIYQAIKVEDSDHTVAMAFNRLFRMVKYFGAFDIAMYDKYPAFYDSPEFTGFEQGIFKKLVETAVSLTQNKSDFWYIIQGYGENINGRPQFNRRLPTEAEEKYMVYTAILADSDGLLFWAHYRSQQEWIDSVLTPIIMELQNYLPAITSRVVDDRLGTDNSQIQASIYRDPNTKDLLLIAINHSDRTLKTAIAIEKSIKADYAVLLAEDRSVNISQGRLTDTFEPYAVHIYRVRPS